ncbi:hypothetical protein CKO09_05710, partial [Chromatium weissei]|nr:hypothetical protein [Chromatium weissei]
TVAAPIENKPVVQQSQPEPIEITSVPIKPAVKAVEIASNPTPQIIEAELEPVVIPIENKPVEVATAPIKSEVKIIETASAPTLSVIETELKTVAAPIENKPVVQQSQPEPIEITSVPIKPAVKAVEIASNPTPPVIETELEPVATSIEVKPIVQSQPEPTETTSAPIKPELKPIEIASTPTRPEIETELESVATPIEIKPVAQVQVESKSTEFRSIPIQPITKNTEQNQMPSQLVLASETTIAPALMNAAVPRFGRTTISATDDIESTIATQHSITDAESATTLESIPLPLSQQKTIISQETQRVIEPRRFQPLFSEQGTLLRPIAIDSESKQNKLENTDNSISEKSVSIPTTPLTTLNIPNAAPSTRPLDLATVLQQGGERYLSEPVKWLVQTNANSVELKLHPANLGAIDVRVTMEAEKAHIQFLSSNSIVRDVLEAALPRLRDSLAQDGLQLGTVSVSDQAAEQRRGSGRELAEAIQQERQHFDDIDAEIQTETPSYDNNAALIDDGLLNDFA